MNEIQQNMDDQAAAQEQEMAPELSQKLQALEEREAALCLRERQMRMRTQLKDCELPEELMECLDLSSDERAEKTLETLAGAFHDAVTRRVKQKLGADPPRAAAAAQDGMAAVRRAMGLK